MAAYVIVRVTVTDPDQYKKYMALAPGAVEAYGGRYIVRGGESEVLEGEPDDRRVAMLEFPSMDQARTFYHSQEYTDVRAVRADAAEMHVQIVESL